MYPPFFTCQDIFASMVRTLLDVDHGDDHTHFPKGDNEDLSG